MSASSRPTRWPRSWNASARFTATVLLPTPPFPAPTAITVSTPGSRPRSAHGSSRVARVSGSRICTSLRTAPASASDFRIAARSRSGTSARPLDSISDTCTRPFRTVTDRTRPRLTMSLLSPGYSTPASAARASASVNPSFPLIDGEPTPPAAGCQGKSNDKCSLGKPARKRVRSDRSGSRSRPGRRRGCR